MCSPSENNCQLYEYCNIVVNKTTSYFAYKTCIWLCLHEVVPTNNKINLKECLKIFVLKNLFKLFNIHSNSYEYLLDLLVQSILV